MTKDGLELVDVDDPKWMPISKKPKKNGWYDVWVDRIKNGEDIHIYALALYRNGEWIDSSNGKLVAWREPLKFEDDFNKPIKNGDGAMRLAEVLAEDIREEYMMAYETTLTCTGRAAKDAAAAIQFLEKQMQTPLYGAFCFAVDADQNDIISIYRRKVKAKVAAMEKRRKKK